VAASYRLWLLTNSPSDADSSHGGKASAMSVEKFVIAC
jgi:hypothetical protein